MELFRPGGLELTDKAASYIDLSAGDRVLDVGCGSGISLCFLKNKYKVEAFGLDIYPGAVENASGKLGEGRVICADACSLPYEEECFDAVFMECVLTLTDDPAKAAKEACRVLKIGGHLVISSLEGADALLDNGRIGREVLLRKLEELGFDITFVFDETFALRQFVAEIIFRYDSIEKYVETANRELGGSVLNCDVPVKGTGYVLIIAKKKNYLEENNE